jgi:hypothetical protein
VIRIQSITDPCPPLAGFSNVNRRTCCPAASVRFFVTVAKLLNPFVSGIASVPVEAPPTLALNVAPPSGLRDLRFYI